jgi:hypothetical protein
MPLKRRRDLILDPQQMFHIGVVVPDLEAWKSRMSATTGQRFLPTTHSEREVTTPDGLVTVQFAVSYSLDPFRVELIQEIPGTIWTTGSGRLHHLGYWAEDFRAKAKQIADAGYPCAASSDSWSYHEYGDFYVELLDAARRPETQARWAAFAGGSRGGRP